jgi:hypothetical protein
MRRGTGKHPVPTDLFLNPVAAERLSSLCRFIDLFLMVGGEDQNGHGVRSTKVFCAAKHRAAGHLSGLRVTQELVSDVCSYFAYNGAHNGV